jgi:glycogen debranching enzyme
MRSACARSRDYAKLQARQPTRQSSINSPRVWNKRWEKCYDEPRGIFFDLLGAVEKPSGVVTVTSLLPLMLDNLDPEICKRLVVEHLSNPNEFWLPYPLPSVAANEPSFDPEAKTDLLWRGSTWVNMNWFLVGGLRRHGY